MQDSLVFTDIVKRYGQGPAILSAFNHTFEPGTATGLRGPNGSGKTTLLRLLSITSFPTEGTLRYGALDVYRHPHQYLAHVGVVHDIASLPAYMTAVELLEYILRSRNQWEGNGFARIDSLLTALNLDDRRHNLIGTYSSGMTKKTQLAAALVTNPAILLLDEPFRGLDEQAVETTLNLLQQRLEAQSILVVSSHRSDILATLCDHFIDLNASLALNLPA